MYTHYSLFDANNHTLADFDRLPDGGLPALLAELHDRALPEKPDNCLGVGGGVLHPKGDQVSFEIQSRGETRFHLILFTRHGLAVQGGELRAEGNPSAKKAIAAFAESVSD